MKNSAADVGATLLDSVGSLFGSSKPKQQQQQIEVLEVENQNLPNDIKELNSKIRTMETEGVSSFHQSEKIRTETEQRNENAALFHRVLKKILPLYYGKGQLFK